MSEYDELIEGYEGLSGEGGVNESSPARRSADVASGNLAQDAAPPREPSTSPPAERLFTPADDPGPLTDEENQTLEESVVPATELPSPPEEQAWPTPPPDEWPGPIEEVEVEAWTELRPLRPDQIPVVGHHYVVFNGKPMPVTRGNYAITEDEHVRSNMGYDPALKDFDGRRLQRADRTLRMRYRGYLCGELQGL